MRRLDTDVYLLTAAARAGNGAARLDEMFGRQWAGWIDPERLDLTDMENDVLGQLYGTYKAARSILKLHRWDCELKGFQALAYLDKCMTEADTHGLEVAWKLEISNRLAMGGETRLARRSPRGSENPSCGND